MDGLRETLAALEGAVAVAQRGAAVTPAATYGTLAACAQCAAFGLPFQGAAPLAAPAAPFAVPLYPTAYPVRAGYGIPVFGPLPPFPPGADP